ncbi:MAG: hypothetical protein JEZ11_03830 [Desulfobacterales bacterium]|nr:hypothetical protein [Desulfobacterales bacterium]
MNTTELEGKIVKLKNWKDEKRAIITGCDKDIGITLMSVDKTKYLYCLVGPSAPNFRDSRLARTYHEEVFPKLVKMLQEGCFDSRIDDDLYEEYFPVSRDGMPSVNSCPFSQ